MLHLRQDELEYSLSRHTVFLHCGTWHLRACTRQDSLGFNKHWTDIHLPHVTSCGANSIIMQDQLCTVADTGCVDLF